MRSVIGKLGKALKAPSETDCGSDCWSRIACAARVSRQLPFIPTDTQYGSELSSSQDEVGLYTRLLPWQTRVIRLHPGNPTDPLECDLLVADITNAEFGLGVRAMSEVVEYEALSYSWGWPERTAMVRCSGVTIGVPPSLATALQYLRNTHTSRVLWCDALCINQEDTVEKSNQVKQMLAIFQKAARIIAWLGELNIHIMRVITAAKLYSAKMYQCRCNVELAVSLTQVLQIKWFRRTWIRQEMFAGDDVNDVYLQSGTETMTFQQLWETYQTLENKLAESSLQDVYHRLQETGSTFRVLRSDVDVSHDPRLSVRAENWLKILNNGSGFGVTDERDRVYGIIGMLASTRQYARHSSRGRLLDFPVDYSRSAHTVFADVIRYLVYLTSNWDCLLVFTGESARQSEFPSWMIDWNLTLPRVVLPSFVTAAQSGNREPGEVYLRDPITQQLHSIDAPLVMRGHGIGTNFQPANGDGSSVDVQNVSKLSDMADFVFGIKGLRESRQYVEILSQSSTVPGKSIHRSTVRLLAPAATAESDVLVQPINTVLPLVLRRVERRAGDVYKVIGPVVFATLVSADELASRASSSRNEAWSSDLRETVDPTNTDKLAIDRTPKSCVSAPRPISFFMQEKAIRKQVDKLKAVTSKGRPDHNDVKQKIREEIGNFSCGHCTQCQIGMAVQTFRLV